MPSTLIVKNLSVSIIKLEDVELTKASGFHLRLELTLCHSALYPNPPGESWSPRSADTLESTGKTTTSAQILGPRETQLKPSGHRNQRIDKDRILPFSTCALELTLCHSSLNPKPTRRELFLQDMLIHLRTQVRLALLLKFLAQEGSTKSYQDTAIKEQTGTGSFHFPPVP
jgi:hypothetical protein